MQNLDWDDLRVFLTVDSAGSLAGAARALAINHSTVLRRLNRLEADLAVRLFEHLPTGYTLTASGEALRDRLRGVEDEIGAAQRQLSGLDTALTGVIRITTTDTLARGLLIRAACRVSREASRASNCSSSSTTASRALTKREADVALRGGNDPPGHLLGRLAGRMETALYASRCVLAYAGRNTGDPGGACVGGVGRESCPSRASPLGRRATFPTRASRCAWTACRRWSRPCAAGIGVGFLLCFLGDRERDLVRVAEPMPALDTRLWVLDASRLCVASCASARLPSFCTNRCERMRTCCRRARSHEGPSGAQAVWPEFPGRSALRRAHRRRHRSAARRQSRRDRSGARRADRRPDRARRAGSPPSRSIAISRRACARNSRPRSSRCTKPTRWSSISRSSGPRCASSATCRTTSARRCSSTWPRTTRSCATCT